MNKTRIPDLPTAALVTVEGEKVLVAPRSETGDALINLTGTKNSSLQSGQQDHAAEEGLGTPLVASGDAIILGKDDGMFSYLRQLSEEEYRNVKFRAALCHAMLEIEGRGVRLTEGRLNTPQLRREIEALGGRIFGEKIGREKRGGSSTVVWAVPVDLLP